MVRLLSVFTSLSKEDKEFKQKLKNILGFSPSNLALYKQAFRHSSSKKEITEHIQSNERLEFLGDSILGAVVAEHLFKLFPTRDEGFLTQMRSRIVNGQHLLVLARKFGLDVLLQSRLTKKEKVDSSAYGDVFEAFIGAIYLDKGYESTKQFILNDVIRNHLDINELLQNNTDYKTQFQILMQRKKNTFAYTIIKEGESGREKTYTVELSINGEPQATFEHKSKKVAEQKVAQVVLEQLGEQKIISN